jgi:hypothetical protein
MFCSQHEKRIPSRTNVSSSVRLQGRQVIVMHPQYTGLHYFCRPSRRLCVAVTGMLNVHCTSHSCKYHSCKYRTFSTRAYKFLPKTGHAAPKEQRYTSTLSLTWHKMGWVVIATLRPLEPREIDPIPNV